RRGVLRINEESGGTLRGLVEEEVELAEAAVCSEHLRTIHHPLSTFETGCGLQITRVRSSAGFGQREACELLTAYHLRKILFLLTGVTELTNSLTTGPVNGERKSGAGAS